MKNPKTRLKILFSSLSQGAHQNTIWRNFAAMRVPYPPPHTEAPLFCLKVHQVIFEGFPLHPLEVGFVVQTVSTIYFEPQIE